MKEQREDIDLAVKYDSFVQKWPHWLRWLVLFPSLFLVPLLILLFTTIAKSLFKADYNPEGFFEKLFVTLIWSTIPIYVGAIVAPKHQFIVAIGIFALGVAVTGMSLMAIILNPTNVALNIVHFAVTVVASGAVVYMLHKDINS